VLITYESMYGNTAAVAEAIAEGASGPQRAPTVLCLPAAQVSGELVHCANLVVIGAPTHYHGLPSRNSLIAGRQLQRRVALLNGSGDGCLPIRPGDRPRLHRPRPRPRVSRSASGSPVPTVVGSAAALVGRDEDEDIDLRAWLRDLPDARPGVQAAAFDTRLTSRWAGGAAFGIARRLRRHGYPLALPPEGFVIDGTLGPLRAGELRRAHSWGAGLRGLLRP
jgi:hypothetical protein